jgi:hypothetical protein
MKKIFIIISVFVLVAATGGAAVFAMYLRASGGQVPVDPYGIVGIPIVKEEIDENLRFREKEGLEQTPEPKRTPKIEDISAEDLDKLFNDYNENYSDKIAGFAAVKVINTFEEETTGVSGERVSISNNSDRDMPDDSFVRKTAFQISEAEVLYTVWGELPQTVKIEQVLTMYMTCITGEQRNLTRKDGVYLFALYKSPDSENYAIVGDRTHLLEIDENGNIYSHTNGYFDALDGLPWYGVACRLRDIRDSESYKLSKTRIGDVIKGKIMIVGEVTSDGVPTSNGEQNAVCKVKVINDIENHGFKKEINVTYSVEERVMPLVKGKKYLLSLSPLSSSDFRVSYDEVAGIDENGMLTGTRVNYTHDNGSGSYFTVFYKQENGSRTEEELLALGREDENTTQDNYSLSEIIDMANKINNPL